MNNPDSDRPFVFCHMLTSLDGKIMGDYMDTIQGIKAQEVFYDLAFGPDRQYQMQGWLSGRVTTDDNFTFYVTPDLDKEAPEVPEGDFITNTGAPMYYVSVDPRGVLGWQKNTLMYNTTKAWVIEILTGQASNAYKAFLRKQNIPYMIAGKTEIDYGMVLAKLKSLFGIEVLMLGGGGILNWTFMQTGLCDELSLVLAAAADGSTKTPSLFTNLQYSQGKPMHFSLIKAKAMDAGSLWLRYKVLNPDKMW